MQPTLNLCFNNLSRLNPSKPRNTKQMGEREERASETHQHNTNYSNKNILWRTFFFEGALFRLGRPCAFVGLDFGKFGIVPFSPCRARILKRDRGHWISLITFIQNILFSLKDLNARHFIWPESVFFLGKFLLYPKSIQFCFWGLYKCWSGKGIPNNSTQNEARCTGKKG